MLTVPRPGCGLRVAPEPATRQGLAYKVFDVSLTELGALDWVTNALVVLSTLAMLVFFSRPAVRGSRTWRATVTPLASIIGSGFLVVAPLLGFTVGELAVVAMAGILVLAYGVGGALRYGIAHVEELDEADGSSRGLDRVFPWLGRVAKLVLALAYVIAVTFYLELLGAFVLRMVGIHDVVIQKAIATGMVVFIGAFGLWRGLSMLEWLEIYAVETKLSIIGGLLVGLVVYNAGQLAAGTWALPRMHAELGVHTLRELLGAFLIVQGFETSRYLRGAYPPELRIRTMRYAQGISGAIYLAFVALATVLMDIFRRVSETGIIDLSARVAFSLPVLLVVGAAMSQFSAAVADTIGSGGLVEEISRGRVSRRITYAAVAGLVILLLWTAHIFEVIAYASRAFALYYAIQCAMAALYAMGRERGRRGWARGGLFAILAAAMALTAAFGIPAESRG